MPIFSAKIPVIFHQYLEPAKHFIMQCSLTWFGPYFTILSSLSHLLCTDSLVFKLNLIPAKASLHLFLPSMLKLSSWNETLPPHLGVNAFMRSTLTTGSLSQWCSINHIMIYSQKFQLSNIIDHLFNGYTHFHEDRPHGSISSTNTVAGGRESNVDIYPMIAVLDYAKISWKYTLSMLVDMIISPWNVCSPVSHKLLPPFRICAFFPHFILIFC